MIFKALELDADDEIPAPFEQADNRKGATNNFNIRNSLAPVVSEIQRKNLFGEQASNQ
jgi:hypothetical protein